MHFSCIPETIHKPSWYESEFKFFDDMFKYAESCTRYYYLERFYESLVRAGARLDPPYWNGSVVPIWNETHDLVVRANKADLNARGFLRSW